MTNLEQLFLLLLGFLVFLVLFVRLGFLIGFTINPFTLPIALVLYTSISALLITSFTNHTHEHISYSALIYFIFAILFFGGCSLLLGKTFDTSWDGQGYHQTAVIALTRDWNPIWEASINLGMRLPSQIFAEGYPTATWEIQATIYSLIGKINAAKVTNLYVAAIAFIGIYILNKRLQINKSLSIFIGILIVVQPVSIIQFLTFMQDGLGYQLLLIAISSLIILSIDKNAYWAIISFILAEILLVSTKYSHLPIALVLGIIFSLIIGNRFLNQEYLFNTKSKFIVFCLIIISVVFAYVPYVKNYIFHNTPFYPINIPDLMGSVKYNNIPLNLQDENRLILLFFGIYSQSQELASGDPRNLENIANLKTPFTFSSQELIDSSMLYNNRVGSGGPLFSGVVTLAVSILLFFTFTIKKRKERYAIYVSYFGFILLLVLSLIAPTPNLLRYVNQLQLIPFVILIPLVVVLKSKFVRLLTYTVLSLVFINNILYLSAVSINSAYQTRAIHSQLQEMSSSGVEYKVRAQHFYSNYVLLEENGVSFEAVDKLNCSEYKSLVASSTTTQYCLR